MLRSIRRSSCRTSRSRATSPRAAPTTCSRNPRPTAEARALPGAVRRREARSARGGGLAAVSALAERRSADRRAERGRADDRDPARAGRFPALVSHADGREPRGEGEGLPQSNRARAGQARECGRRLPRAAVALLRARALRRAAAHAARVFSCRADPCAHLYEDFRRDNEATVREVQRFLGVDDTVPLQQVETEPLSTVRSVRMHELIRAVRRADFNPAQASGLSRALNALVPKRVPVVACSRGSTGASPTRRRQRAGRGFMRDLRAASGRGRRAERVPRP